VGAGFFYLFFSFYLQAGYMQYFTSLCADNHDQYRTVTTRRARYDYFCLSVTHCYCVKTTEL